MAVEIADVSKLDVEPGELPESMAAWVIRAEREGEPKNAFQVEEIEVPEPGAFEVIVRVMAAGVNFNNVWAALGEPVSVFNYGDHPEWGHHIGGSDASGIVWNVGAGVTKWKPGDEVVIHCNQASYEDVEVHGLDPLAAPSQMIWGYETTWGSFAQFTKVQAQQLLPKPRNLSWVESSAYGLTYFTAYRMLVDRCKVQAGHNVLIWGAAGGLGVFATQLCKAAGAESVGVVSSAEKGELVKRLGAVDYIDRNEFAGMMRRGGESKEEEKERFKVSRAFSKRVKEILGAAPDVVFEHVGKATFPSRRWRSSRACRCATARRATTSTATATTATSSSRSSPGTTSSTGSASGRARTASTSGSSTPATTRCPSCTPGWIRSRTARSPPSR